MIIIILERALLDIFDFRFHQYPIFHTIPVDFLPHHSPLDLFLDSTFLSLDDEGGCDARSDYTAVVMTNEKADHQISDLVMEGRK